jgi:hypothetical protein
MQEWARRRRRGEPPEPATAAGDVACLTCSCGRGRERLLDDVPPSCQRDCTPPWAADEAVPGYCLRMPTPCIRWIFRVSFLCAAAMATWQVGLGEGARTGTPRVLPPKPGAHADQARCGRGSAGEASHDCFRIR